MKKVLAVIGSPRKHGNTYALTRIIEDRLKEQGDVEFEYLYLGEADLKRCRGCEVCVVHGEDRCPLDDNRAAIGQKMAEADGVIFASPVYNFFITGLMKEFVDRFTYAIHRPRFFGKPALVIVVRGGLFRQAVKYLSRVARRWGFSVVGQLGLPELPKDEAGRAKGVQKTRAAADGFYRFLMGQALPAPGLGDLFWFRMWQSSSQFLEADKAYWKERGWYQKNYYYPCRAGLLKRALAVVGGKTVRVMMRQMFKGAKFDF